MIPDFDYKRDVEARLAGRSILRDALMRLSGGFRVSGDLNLLERVAVDPEKRREFDLAMLRLFGGFGHEVFAAYQDPHPPAPGEESTT